MHKNQLLAIPLLLLLLCSACTYLPAETTAEPFGFEEAAHIFALTESALFETYGEPDGEKPASFQGLQANEFLYGKNSFRAEAASGYVYSVCLYDEMLEGPRGAAPGMKIADLVALFASGGDNALYQGPDGEQYRLLYGSYETGGDYGVIFYDGRTPLCVEYSSEGCVFACGIENGKVSCLEFFVE